MLLNNQALQLLHNQLKTWPLAAANYAALAQTQNRKVPVQGYDFTVQCNPARITSSTANIDPKAIQERTCFLCRHHLPPEQESLPYTTKNGIEYLILCNPYPVFPRHLTIPDSTHTAQLISGRIEDMLEMAGRLSDFVLFYNGPKCGASAPDHFHFQAGSKGFLPIQALVESGASLAQYPVPLFVFESEEAESVTLSFHIFFTALQTLFPQTPEPMLNILCWKGGAKYFLVLFPRKQHRPAQFFAQGDDHILLSPAAIDLGGVLITPLEKDWQKLSASDITDIFCQIGINRAIYKQLSDMLHI